MNFTFRNFSSINISFFLFLLIIIQPVFADSSEYDPNPDKYEYTYIWGISSGPALSNIGNTKKYLDTPGNIKSFNLLVDFEIKSNKYEYKQNSTNNTFEKHNGKNWFYGVKFGLGYITKGYDLGEYTKTDNTGHILGVFSTEIYKSYMYIPVNFTLYHNIFYAKAGLFTAFLINSDDSSDDLNSDFDHSIFNSLDTGLDIGAGIEIMISNKFKIKIGYTYQYSISKDYAGNNYSHILSLGLRSEDFKIF